MKHMLLTPLLLINTHCLIAMEVIHENNPLIEEIKNQNIDGVKEMISKGLDVNIPDKKGSSPLSYAIIYQNSEIINILTNSKADINFNSQNGMSPLHSAIRKNSIETTKLLLEKGVDVSQKLRYPYLHEAVLSENYEITDLLIQHNANVNDTDILGRSPLYYAACNGLVGIVKLLVSKGAEFNKEEYEKTIMINFSENDYMLNLLRSCIE